MHSRSTQHRANGKPFHLSIDFRCISVKSLRFHNCVVNADVKIIQGHHNQSITHFIYIDLMIYVIFKI